MSTDLLRAMLLAAVFAVGASAGAAEGKALYASKCQSCHGPGGEGKDAIAKMFKVTMQPLGSKEVQGKSDADLKKVITAGQGKMKPVTGLDDAQATDIVAHVRTLKK
jgi:mono/diheme cytochrome c family protein